MKPSFLKFIFIPIVIFLGNINHSATAPKYISENPEPQNLAVKIKKTLPIIQNWRTRMQLIDSSITKFVSKNIGLYDKKYEPSDLEFIGGIREINEAGRIGKLRKEARDSLWKMAKDFEKEFHEPLIVISGYRSAEYQQRMWELGKCSDTLCAPPGYSEHQLGLAIDLFDASTEEEYFKNPKYKKYVNWLQENAYKYGWHQSYQKGEEIDAYEIEPWHWRYLGVNLATKLQGLKWTFTEYTRFHNLLDWQ